MKQYRCRAMATVKLSTILAAVLSIVAYASHCNAEGPADSTNAADLEELLPPGVEMFHIKYLSRHHVMELLRAFEIEYESINNYGRTKLFIRFKNPLSAVRARKLIAKFDVPPRRIEIHLRQILASNAAFYEAVDGVKRMLDRPIPDQTLQDQLKQAFKFRHYNLLGSGRSISSAGSRSKSTLQSSSSLKLTDASGDVVLNFSRIWANFWLEYIDEGKGVIQLRDLKFNSAGEIVLNAALNIKNGETVIVGSSVHDRDDIAIITVVSARTVD
ncbi:MAG: hypothetical protein OYM47_13950 [Gemmatimonadota bacterium]|nr:hypothetical protein [Gemmatimonadota bacterium]